MDSKQTAKPSILRKLLLIGGIVFGILLLGAGVAYWLYADKLNATITAATNDYIKGMINRDAGSRASQPMTAEIGTIDYAFFARTLDLSHIRITMGDKGDTSSVYMEINIPHVHASGVNPWDILFGDGLALGDITIDDPTVYRREIAGSLTDSLILAQERSDQLARDTSLVTLPHLPDVDSLVGSLLGAILPSNIKPLWVASFAINEGAYVLADSKRRSTGGAMVGVNVRFNGLSIRDTSETYRAVNQSYLSVRRWTRPFADGDTVNVYGGRVVVDEKDSSMYVDSVEYLVPQTMRTFAKGIHISFRAKTLAIDSFNVFPTISDAAVFAKTPYRSDRSRVAARGIVLREIDTRGLVEGTALRAQTLDFTKFYIDVLSNSRGKKRKNNIPKMPYEQVAAIPFRLGLDSIRLQNTSIVYGELHPNSNTPAILAFERIHLLVTGLSNDPEVQKRQPVKIYGKGAFQKNGVMDLEVTIPLNVKQNTIDVQASLSEMDLKTFNTFLPIAENIRVKNGWVKKATVRVKVRGLKSTGLVTPQYIDFELAVLNSKSKKVGFWEGIASAIANWLKIKNENVPGPDMKVGPIAYTIPRDASIFQAVWFPVRDGLGEVIGF